MSGASVRTSNVSDVSGGHMELLDTGWCHLKSV